MWGALQGVGAGRLSLGPSPGGVLPEGGGEGGNSRLGRVSVPPQEVRIDQVLTMGRGDCKGDQGQGAFFTLPHRLVVSVFPFLSLLFSVEAGDQMQ